MRVVGFDPSLNNWGIATGNYDPSSGLIDVHILDVTRPVLSKGKTVRKNSQDLEAATQLARAAIAHSKEAHVVFVEVPHGSQSARAMASYGICLGVLASLRAIDIPFFELTAVEVKMASVGSKTATKQDMIQWAMETFPGAPWPMQKRQGVLVVVEGLAEHMADACATIHAGTQLQTFKQLQLMRAS